MKEAMQSVCIGIWSWFGGSWSGIKRKKWKKWKKWQKELKNYVFLISHEHAENSHSRAKWTKREFGYSLKGKSENWFRMTMQKFRTVMRNTLGRQKWCWWIFHFAQSCQIVGAYVKLHFFFQISWWRSLRKTS